MNLDQLISNISKFSSLSFVDKEVIAVIIGSERDVS